MAASTFDDALRRLLIHEGGYTNHPSDPGGPTKFGITIHDYRNHVKARASAADVRAMRLEEAEAIYRDKYWQAMRCDELPAGLDYAVFDYEVNSGVSRAAKVLQRLLGFSADGRIGDALLAAVRKRDAADLIARLCDERLAFLQRLKTWPVFGAGWGHRVKEVRAAALAMAKSRTGNKENVTMSPGKGVAPVNRKAQQASVGGIAAAGAAAAHQAHQSGVRLAIIIAMAAAALVLAAAAWWWWRRRQRHQQER